MRDDRPSPIFVADVKGLDFLNSIATPVDVPVEWLGSGDDLLAWIREARLAPADVLRALKRNSRPAELDAVAAEARSLREWFRRFVYDHKGKPLTRGALRRLEPLNRVLARDEEFGQIVARDHGHEGGHALEHDEDHFSELVWSPRRHWRTPDTLLLPIAHAVADVICGVDFTYIKACEGRVCTLVFLDRTRGHARRWCSMAVCGNRAKQAALRERRH